MTTTSIDKTLSPSLPPSSLSFLYHHFHKVFNVSFLFHLPLFPCLSCLFILNFSLYTLPTPTSLFLFTFRVPFFPNSFYLSPSLFSLLLPIVYLFPCLHPNPCFFLSLPLPLLPTPTPVTKVSGVYSGEGKVASPGHVFPSCPVHKLTSSLLPLSVFPCHQRPWGERGRYRLNKNTHIK